MTWLEAAGWVLCMLGFAWHVRRFRRPTVQTVKVDVFLTENGTMGISRALATHDSRVNHFAATQAVVNLALAMTKEGRYGKNQTSL